MLFLNRAIVAAAAFLVAGCSEPTRPRADAIDLVPHFTIAPTIEITDLGALASGPSIAHRINEDGAIVGVHNFNVVGPNYSVMQTGVMWRNGTVTDLGTLPGGQFSRAFDINDLEQVVGYAGPVALTEEGGYRHAFLWQNGVMRDLHPPEEESSWSEARAINDLGQVVGWVDDGGDDEQRAFLWQNGITSFIGGEGTNAHDINNNGQVVGQALIGDQYRAVLWQSGTMTELVPPAGGEDPPLYGSTAHAINDKGQVVGFLTTASGRRAFVWENGVVKDLGTLPGHASSYAFGINDHGQIVGWSSAADGSTRAVLWQDAAIIDLGTLHYANSYAHGINNDGQIVGSSWDANSPDNTHHRALLWTIRLTPPTPEEQVASVSTDVQELASSGALATNSADALLAKLDATTRALNQENTQAAINLLSAFVNQVQAFVNAGKLAADAGASLIEQANAVIAQLKG